MKKLFLILTFSLISFASFAQYVAVRGYTKSNGTYVQPHYRTAPDGVKWNNLSR